MFPPQKLVFPGKAIFPVFKPKIEGRKNSLRWIHILLRGGLHLELIHSGLGLGDIQLVAVLGRHRCVLLSCCGANALVGYRNGSFAARQRDMHEKQWQMLDTALKKDGQTGVFMVY
jgi:hypothetical protein